MLEIDLGSVPWSRQGSYMTLSTLVRELDHPGREQAVKPGLYLFDVSGCRFFGAWNGVFRLEGLAGDEPVTLRVRSASPSRLVLDSGGGSIEVTWDGPDTLRFRGHGSGLRLTQSVLDPLGSAIAFPRDERSWHLLMGENPHYLATSLQGQLTVQAPRVRTGPTIVPDGKVVDIRPGVDASFELALTQYETGVAQLTSPRPFEACVAQNDADFNDWLREQLPVPRGYEDARMLAAYVTWSCLVGPRGLLSRPTMLMSKNWMFATWSWDHCFNALALAERQPDLAWDQLMSPFDQQHPDGALPDLVHDYGRMYGFVKPPVHGWTVRKLLAAGVITDDRLTELYPRLAGWTEWWLAYRDADRDGLCEHHHGNDGGLDNGTVYDVGLPVIGPDLAAFLILQMDVLADLADRLDKPSDAAAWRQRADAMLSQLIGRLWDGERFRAVRAGDYAVNASSESIVPFLPLVLGDRLPPDVRCKLVESFEQSGLLTDFGPATERPGGELYQADGYWRGPIWAPTTLLVVDGLRACGETELASRVARSFVRTCGASGFAENFEATTGRPLRDPAYSWTASVFLVLASEYLVPRPTDQHAAKGVSR
jgi:hypothetical protein